MTRRSPLSKRCLGNLGWAVLALAVLLPVSGWAHGEVEGAGEEKALRTVEGKSGKYRLELTVSPPLPVAGDNTNMELKVVRLLPKPDPLLGTEVPVSTKPGFSIVYEGSQKILDSSLAMHDEGEAGVFGVDEYRFQGSGSLLLRFLIHPDAGEDFTVDFPVTVKTNVAALFRLWVNLAVAVLILGLTGLQLWKVRARGGQASEMVRPVAVGAICWIAVFLVMKFFVLDQVLALRKPPAASASAPPVTTNPDGSYSISAEVQKTLGLQLVEAREMPVEQTLSAYGSVEAKPDLMAQVVAPLWGRIEFPKQPLAVGDKVKKSQELVNIFLELSQVERGPMEAKADDIKGVLQKTKERRDAAQIEYDRDKKLAAANPAYEQDVKWAKELLDDAQSAFQQITKEDQTFAVTMKSRDPRKIPVQSPMNGTITSVDFTPGQLDVNGDFRKLFTIVDTSVVWARADVYLTDVLNLKAGEEVLVHPSGRPERALKGTLHWIGDTVDAVNRTVPVIVEVSNPDAELALGGFVRIEFSRSRQKAVAVPEQAVVDDGATKRIYVAVGPEKFQPMQVEVGVRQGGWLQVVSGLQEGDRVIAKGAALLASIRKEEPAAEQGSLGSLPPVAPASERVENDP